MLLHEFDKEPGYNPNALITGVRVALAERNDAGLARRLRVGPPILSKVRNYRAPVTAALLLRMHEVSQLPLATLRQMMGIAAS